jgi:competence protein ComEA
MATFPLGVHGRRVLAVALLALVLVVVAWRHASAARAPVPLRVAPIAPARSPSAAAGRLLVVDVVGAVRRPGLVRLHAGARVADAIARAGGLRRNADRAGVNLAAPVADGQQVLVPPHLVGQGGAAVAAGGGSGAGGGVAVGPVSLSSASVEQLDALPGVGPVTAEKIIMYRQQHGAFRSVDELDAIAGIGPSRIADLRGLVVP